LQDPSVSIIPWNYNNRHASPSGWESLFRETRNVSMIEGISGLVQEASSPLPLMHCFVSNIYIYK
jgi:hypothetical protein